MYYIVLFPRLECKVRLVVEVEAVDGCLGKFAGPLGKNGRS